MTRSALSVLPRRVRSVTREQRVAALAGALVRRRTVRRMAVVAASVSVRFSVSQGRDLFCVTLRAALHARDPTVRRMAVAAARVPIGGTRTRLADRDIERVALTTALRCLARIRVRRVTGLARVVSRRNRLRAELHVVAPRAMLASLAQIRTVPVIAVAHRTLHAGVQRVTRDRTRGTPRRLRLRLVVTLETGADHGGSPCALSGESMAGDASVLGRVGARAMDPDVRVTRRARPSDGSAAVLLLGVALQAARSTIRMFAVALSRGRHAPAVVLDPVVAARAIAIGDFAMCRHAPAPEHRPHVESQSEPRLVAALARRARMQESQCAASHQIRVTAAGTKRPVLGDALSCARHADCPRDGQDESARNQPHGEPSSALGGAPLDHAALRHVDVECACTRARDRIVTLRRPTFDASHRRRGDPQASVDDEPHR